MPLPVPNLDDRSFEELVEEARGRIGQACPEWDLSPSDPAAVLVDAFAHVTEVMIYRLNRTPEKAYIEFLNLLGLRMQPPTAAAVELTFYRARAADSKLEIPRGTRVAVSRPTGSAPPPMFVTAGPAHIDAGKLETTVNAYQGEFIEAELVGSGTGKPGLSVATRRAPIVAATAGELALVVGVEVAADKLEERAPAVRYREKVYRVWDEVESFTNLKPGALAYIVDRTSGIITFAPALRLRGGDGFLEEAQRALAAVPEAGREIRVWYWCGGGPAGNVAAETLTTLKDSVAGVSVTNRARATGGRAGETLENALRRGPEEFRSLERAVTASDFELLAKRNGAVSRAKAITKAQVWAHAAPGTVEVLLVPELPADALKAPLEAEQVAGFHTETTRAQIARVLDQRRPLGTTCLVSWARYKTVRVAARIVAYRQEDAAALQRRVTERLYGRLNPVAWQFGQALRASHFYDLVLAEPGVNYVDGVRFQVDDVPGRDVNCVISDPFQRRTWHAASGDSVFRSMNDGDGWERTARFHGETVEIIAAHPGKPGLLAVATALPGDAGHSAVYFSSDDGESWTGPTPTAFSIDGLAWSMREDVPVLFMATSVGLYEVALVGARPTPVQVLVDAKKPDRGFTAVAVLNDVRGGVSVAIASQETGGVWLSSDGGRSSSFRHVGLDGLDVRVLVPQYDGPRVYLWAGSVATGPAPGSVARLEAVGSEIAPGGWQRYAKGWPGESCRSLTFLGPKVFAASYESGVLQADISAPDPEWIAPKIDCGLPQRGPKRIFQWVKSVAATPASGVILCGGPVGVYRSIDTGSTYQGVSSPTYADTVTLPDAWLFCSGQHRIEVVQDNESR